MNRGDDDNENNEEKKILASRKQFKEHNNNESDIPELICKIDKDDSSDDSSDEDTPRRKENLPLEKRLEQLKEAIERMRSAQRGNRMPGLQERDREDSDSESDNEEEDDNNEIPSLQDRNIEDSESEDDEEDSSADTFDDDLYFVPSDEDEDGSITSENDNIINMFPRPAIDELDEEEAEAIGSPMDTPKLPGMIRISGCNPDGIKAQELQSQLQHSMDLGIDIQCYSEVNRNFLRTEVRHKFYEGTKSMDRSSKAVWGTSLFTTDSNYKPGGTAIVTRGKTAGRVKKSGSDKLGRWTYQLLDGQGNKDILIVSIYQCCKQPTNPGGHTAYHQQEVLLSERDSTDRDPRRNFFRDIKEFIKKFLSLESTTIIPFIIGDWNEECKGSSTSQKLCNAFGL